MPRNTHTHTPTDNLRAALTRAAANFKAQLAEAEELRKRATIERVRKLIHERERKTGAHNAAAGSDVRAHRKRELRAGAASLELALEAYSRESGTRAQAVAYYEAKSAEANGQLAVIDAELERITQERAALMLDIANILSARQRHESAALQATVNARAAGASLSDYEANPNIDWWKRPDRDWTPHPEQAPFVILDPFRSSKEERALNRKLRDEALPRLERENEARKLAYVLGCEPADVLLYWASTENEAANEREAVA